MIELNYNETNELYKLLSDNYDQDIDDEVTYKLAGAINLVDECGMTRSDLSSVRLYQSPNRVFAKFNITSKWPDYLIDEINVNHEQYNIETASRDVVLIELL